jgi:hypothetical protein
LIAHRHRDAPLRLRSVQRFPDGVVQLHYNVERTARGEQFVIHERHTPDRSM